MTNSDFVNGLFEMVGGCLLLVNVRRLWRDRKIAGVSWLPTVFFAVWGVWNLWFYPSVHCPWSFAGGIVVVSANVVWLSLLWWVSRERVAR